MSDSSGAARPGLGVRGWRWGWGGRGLGEGAMPIVECSLSEARPTTEPCVGGMLMSLCVW